ELVGASTVIVGTFTLDGADLRVDAHRIQIDAGRVDPDVTERAPLRDLVTIFEKLARRLAPDAAAGAAQKGRPPLDAYENYVKELIADSPASQATFLETAIRQHPGYDLARLALWDVLTDQGDYATALAVARSVPAASKLAVQARFLAGL